MIKEIEIPITKIIFISIVHIQNSYHFGTVEVIESKNKILALLEKGE